MADYRVELPNAEPLMVRANNKAQAIRYATHKLVRIELLTTEEAIRLGKAGQELHDATGEPEADQGLPLLEQSLKAGDVAFVNKGDLEGTKVTVNALAADDQAEVKWFEGEEAKEAILPLADLTLAVEPPDNGEDKATVKPTNRRGK